MQNPLNYQRISFFRSFQNKNHFSILQPQTKLDEI